MADRLRDIMENILMSTVLIVASSIVRIGTEFIILLSVRIRIESRCFSVITVCIRSISTAGQIRCRSHEIYIVFDHPFCTRYVEHGLFTAIFIVRLVEHV